MSTATINSLAIKAVLDGTEILEISEGGTGTFKTAVSGFSTIFQLLSLKNAASGYAGLDASSLLNVAQIPTAIPAINIADSTVDNTEFQFLNGVTSLIQTQLDATEKTANKGAVSGYAALDASQELLLANFPSGTGLQVLRRNTGNTALEFATPAALEFLGPWTATHDAGGFTLDNLGVLISNATNPALAGVIRIGNTEAITWRNAANTNNVDITVSAGDTFLFRINGSTQLSLSSTQLNIQNNTLVMGSGVIQFRTANASIQENATNGLEIDVATGESIFLRVNNVTEYEASPTAFILNTNILQFNDANTSIVQSSADLQYDVATGGTHDLRINNALEYEFSATQANFLSNNLVNAIMTSTVTGVSGITGLGTITTGVWNGTAITGANINAASTDLTDTADIAYLNTANTWITGLQNFSAVTLRIPVSATPSVTVNGDIAFDSLVTDFTTGLIKFFGIEEQGIVAMPIAQFTTPSDGFVVSYNATNDEFELTAAGVGDMVLASIQIVTGAKTFGTIGGAVGKFILAGSTSGSTILNAAAVAGTTTVTLQGVTGTVALLGNKLSDFAATTSAELITVISDETGSGLLVFGTSPVLITPALGTPSALVLTNATGLPPAGVVGVAAVQTDNLSVFAATTSAQLAGVISDETGSGLLVFGTAPTVDSASLSFAINAQTGTSYTFVLLDAGKVVTSSNAAAVTVTIPPNSSVAYPIGSSLTVISIGVGLTSFAQGAGVTITSTGAVSTAPVLRIQHSSATAIKTATDTWRVVGDIS